MFAAQPTKPRRGISRPTDHYRPLDDHHRLFDADEFRAGAAENTSRLNRHFIMSLPKPRLGQEPLAIRSRRTPAVHSGPGMRSATARNNRAARTGFGRAAARTVMLIPRPTHGGKGFIAIRPDDLKSWMKWDPAHKELK
jgi:hypothetical protein